MADDDKPQDDQFLTNNPDDTNPIEEMKQKQKLPEDYDTPYSPPSGVQDRIDDTHPVTDTNIDNDRYDAGIEGAAGVDLPDQAADEDEADIPDAA